MFGDTLTSRPRFGAGGRDRGPARASMIVDGGRVSVEAQLAESLVSGVTVVDLSGSTGAAAGSGVAQLEVDARVADAGPARGRRRRGTHAARAWPTR